MFKQLLNKKMLKNEKGLTLIELLAVIVILAIIAAIAIPAIGNIIDNSRDKAIISEGLNIIAGAKIAKMDGVCDGGSTACNETSIANYVEGIPSGANFTASYASGEWSLTYSQFSKTTTTKYKVTGKQKESALKAKINQ